MFFSICIRTFVMRLIDFSSVFGLEYIQSLFFSGLVPYHVILFICF